MENIEKIVNYQKKINELMKKYEDITRKMLDCSFDDILAYTESRAEISRKADRLNSEILEVCEESSPEYEAYKHLCGRSELPDEIKEIFDLRLEFKSIAVRVQSMEPEITQRISIRKEKLLVKIKENNSGQNAKAAKFFNAGLSNGGKVFFPENKKTI